MDHPGEKKYSTGNAKPFKSKIFIRLEKCLYVWLAFHDK